MLKESYYFELGSLYVDFKCVQMENMFQKRGELENILGLWQEVEFLEVIKQSRKELERLRSFLKGKMKEMKLLRKYIFIE